LPLARPPPPSLERYLVAAGAAAKQLQRRRRRDKSGREDGRSLKTNVTQGYLHDALITVAAASSQQLKPPSFSLVSSSWPVERDATFHAVILSLRSAALQFRMTLFPRYYALTVYRRIC